ncbi:unnamed protein product [Brachionus calyciflorus]|uniref:Uncharacterized protein n=1 Tax=Brachionus calyciflorus TaxID=104777 RepID=A0A813TF05_9BILA|nr:unnamed protein product [Brachionus calyciflorus]
MKKFKSEDLHEEFKMLYKQRSELSFGKKNLMIKSASIQRPKKFLNDIMFSEKLFETVETLLYDANSKVKLAAATSIFIILKKFSRPYIEKYQMTKNKAEYVLRDALKAFSSVDRFTAALTLGNDGYADVTIINILLSNYYNSNEQYTKEQVTQCLSDLSSHNQIIGRKMEEYLKSEHVRERILTCKLIPCLRAPLSKKTVTKLIELMWNDINHNVKKVAAQTLGRTGRGREIHDEIFKRLHSRNIFDRMSALKVINYIGIMTPKLLEIYLKCFRDDCLSVRQLACLACQKLYEKDDKIVDALVFMARFDPASKLKALSIRTLGLIGSYNSDIRSALMWALQFEMDPIIRTEACHSIILLNNQKDQELIDILLERHLVEEESIVRKEIMDALIHLGYDPNRELPIVTKIKEDIKKLNDKNVIISKILEIEKKHDFEFEKKRLIWDENDDDGLKKDSCRDAKSESSYESFGPFEPRLIEKSKKNNSNIFRKAKNSKNSNFLSKLVQIDNKELTLSLSSLNFDSNSFEEYANDHEYKKSLNDTNLSSQRIKTIVEERD